MEAFQLLGHGFDILMSPMTMVLIFLGVIWGSIFGVVPGIGSCLAMLLILPILFPLDLSLSLAILAAVYCGGTFGGSFSSILLNIPGGSENVCTSFDGHPMAKKGQASKALQAAVFSSALGGFLGALFFIFVAPSLAHVALKFSDADYFGFMVMGVMVLGSVSGDSLLKGLISGLLGFLAGSVGMAATSGVVRFTFGSMFLGAGFSFVVVMIGLFGLAEVFSSWDSSLQKKEMAKHSKGESFGLAELWRQKINLIRSTLLGVFAGIVPGIGATLASFLSYGVAKTVSRKSDQFGKGIVDGVVAPETANNASTGGAMIPLFTLGIPGGSVTAIMLAVLVMKGVQPGPLIFTSQAKMVGTIMVALLVSNLFVLLVGRYGVPVFVSILKINYSYIITAVSVFCVLGSYSIRNIPFDIYIVILAGILGYFWKKKDFPIAPFILALVLGPMAEYRFINALSQEDSLLKILLSPVGFSALCFGFLFMVPSIVTAIKSSFFSKEKKVVSTDLSYMTPVLYGLLILGAVLLWTITNTWPVEGRPAGWPRIILLSLMILSGVEIIWWLNDFRIARADNPDLQMISIKEFFVPDGPRVFLGMATVIAYGVMQHYLGFLLATVVFCLVMLPVAGIREKRNVVFFTMGIMSVITILFVGLLHCYYPTGQGFMSDITYWIYDILFAIFE